jgi:hypothetical protein
MMDSCFSPKNLIRLQSAVLCANCEVVSEGTNGHCAACGSQALLSLSRILGGPLASPMPFDFADSSLITDERLRSMTYLPAA